MIKKYSDRKFKSIGACVMCNYRKSKGLGRTVICDRCGRHLKGVLLNELNNFKGKE